MTGKRNLRRSTRSVNPNSNSSTTSKDRELDNNGTKHNLRWNIQSQKIVKELAKIYFDGEKEGNNFTDVTLFSSDGECVQAHKIVLMLCSQYFQKLFIEVGKYQKKEHNNTIVVLGNITADNLRRLIRLMYTGEASITTDEEKHEFAKLSKQFQLDDVSSSEPQQCLTSEDMETNLSDSQTTSSHKQKQSTTIKSTKVVNRNEDTSISSQRLNQDDLNKSSSTDCVPLKESEPEVTPCKIEPIESTNSFDDDKIDFGLEDNYDESGVSGGEENAIDSAEDEEESCSDDDDDDDKVKDPDVSFHTTVKKPKKQMSAREARLEDRGPKLSWRTGRLKGLIRIDPISEEELNKHWRKKSFHDNASNTVKFYYCPYGGSKGKNICPATLKIKTLIDGTKLYFRNHYDHANHRSFHELFGLTRDQREFVETCVRNGITQPNNILYKFELDGLIRPTKLKLYNMLARLKKKPEWSIYWTKKEPKWPRRIRKKPEKVGPPKKVGRPSKEELDRKKKNSETSAISNMTPTSSASFANDSRQHQLFGCSQSQSSSSSPINPTTSASGTGYQLHMNHFPGGFPTQPPPHYQF